MSTQISADRAEQALADEALEAEVMLSEAGNLGHILAVGLICDFSLY